MNQTWANGEKRNFGPNFDPFGSNLIGRCPNNAERPKSLKLDGTFLSFAISFEISSLTQNHLLDENYLPLQQTHISVLS